MKSNLTRRQFIHRSAAGASAMALLSAGAARSYAANEKAQIAWIGIGGRGSEMLTEFVKSCPDARTVAVCDLIPERVEKGKKIAEKDQPRGYTDFHEMMDKEKLDGIFVMTECCNHANVAVPVLERNIHCFAEKPMDITVEKVDQIVAAARKSKGFYQIGTQRRYHPSYLSAMKAIHDGLLGRITFMQGGWHWSGDPSPVPVKCDGGRLIEQASHHTDVMAWVMKDQHPVTCVAMAYAQRANEFPGGPNAFSETHSVTTFQFPGGELFTYTHLHILPGRYDQEILTVFGEKGSVDLNQCMYYGRDEKQKRLGEPSGKNWRMGQAEELQDFVANIRSGGTRKPNANVETGRICTLMCIMGRMAMVNKDKNVYEPRVIRWEDLGSKTEL